MTWHQVLAMASLIEEEALLIDEMRTISGVFHNRLKINMLLQSDPTAIYDMDVAPDTIKPAHLKRDSPYNTYKIKGLPPGPICNPGLNSILAAVEPADNNYLYFVAAGDGSHYFAKSYREHRKNINRARKNRR